LLPPVFGLAALLGLSSCGNSNEPSDRPTILLMNPRVVTRGSGFGLWVYGENFGEGATINWNGVPRETNVSSSTVLSTAIVPADVPSEGTVPVTVSRPGGWISPPRIFTIGFERLGPAMTLTSVTPEKGTVGSGDVEITATGTGFVPGTALFLNGAPLETTLVSGTTLSAVIPAASLQVSQQLELKVGVPSFWVTPTGLTWEVAAATP
jgi:hypothetical protein